MSMEGWWIVHTMVLPVLTMLRTVRITMAAARASRPALQYETGGWQGHVDIQDLLNAVTCDPPVIEVSKCGHQITEVCRA